MVRVIEFDDDLLGVVRAAVSQHGVVPAADQALGVVGRLRVGYHIDRRHRR